MHDAPAHTSISTDYNAYVINALSRMTRSSGAMDQRVLRKCLGLSSSYLLTDATMNPNGGLTTWYAGLSRIVDVMSALHKRDELELETVSEASKACSECWGVAGGWRELEAGMECIKDIATRLKGLLDDNGRTFHGQRIYIP